MLGTSTARSTRLTFPAVGIDEDKAHVRLTSDCAHLSGVVVQDAFDDGPTVLRVNVRLDGGERVDEVREVCAA